MHSHLELAKVMMMSSVLSEESIILVKIKAHCQKLLRGDQGHVMTVTRKVPLMVQPFPQVPT